LSDQPTITRCPFCCSDDITLYTGAYGGVSYQLLCHRCLADGPAESTKEKAIESWNRRTDGWISVKDRLPKRFKPVFFCVPYHDCDWFDQIKIGHLVRKEEGELEAFKPEYSGLRTWDISVVTHWRELMDLPKEYDVLIPEPPKHISHIEPETPWPRPKAKKEY